MNTRTTDHTEAPDRGARLRTELIVASVWLAVGLFLVPPVIYLVGTKLLGPYGDNNAGLSTFYGAFFADLASGSPRTWTLALGPLVLISLVRLLYIGVGARRPADDHREHLDPPPRPAPPISKERKRIEPRVG